MVPAGQKDSWSWLWTVYWNGQAPLSKGTRMERLIMCTRDVQEQMMQALYLVSPEIYGIERN